ncbi:hypothetical protein SS1G_03517 [Sclerotinia sclerotiorum 1980 UF-70]|uniref:Glycosyltransferase family 1 protein n=1 Tax=Sclerotinia sclerotiorum (strain ATCC 18683 / 1980 / Ss-1) TaxID=665079 RepID=A7EDX7_SCLS1|nr:hypothetical protein SS1G_03517 [Sclerotinia sclerotiorum 1980 UF-70]EDO01043.1 hypothetical protein SS1G_03517 [Sclerotinia sclerotiorum 1980 UF-70]
MFRRPLYFVLATAFAYIAYLFAGSVTQSEKNTTKKLGEWPGKNNTVLFLTNSEHGLANVMLATSHALLVEHNDLDIHFVSFEKLKHDITTISEFAAKNSKSERAITFHELKGPSFSKAIEDSGIGIDQVIHAPGLAGLGKFCGNMQHWLMPWTATDHLGLYNEISDILKTVDPIVVAVDPLFGPGIDAVRAQGRNHAIISPNSLKDNFVQLQPMAAALWKYPASQELDFPFDIIPKNIIQCGPIYLSTAPASEQDPELTEWLKISPTILINLGSSVNYDEPAATEMAKSIKILLENSTIQVLWKFNKRHEFSDQFLDILSSDLQSQRVKITNWIKVDPAALLETGNIILSVHHGGANCFHEAIGTGIPQVVLPMWVDLYDFAIRVEFLGVGVWGSRGVAPYWKAEELSSVFLKLVGDSEEAISMRKRALELSRPWKEKPGRVTAAHELAKLARLAPIS